MGGLSRRRADRVYVQAVAIKLLRALTNAAAVWFRRARTLRLLDHPGITLLDGATESGQPYLVMGWSRVSSSTSIAMPGRGSGAFAVVRQGLRGGAVCISSLSFTAI